MVNHDLQNEAKSREMHGVTWPHKVCYGYKQWYTCDPHNGKSHVKRFSNKRKRKCALLANAKEHEIIE